MVYRFLLFPLLLLAPLAGCAKIAGPDPAREATMSAAEQAKRAMIGSQRDQLIAKFGNPDQIIDATLLGRPPTEAYVYTPKDGAKCYDAFSVVEKSGEVIDYFCR